MAAQLSKRMQVFPTHIVLFYILHYTFLNGIYFGMECHAVEPKVEAMLRS